MLNIVLTNNLKKISVLLILVCLIPVMIISIYSCKLSSKLMFERMEKSTLLEMQNANDEINEILKNVEAAMNSITVNKNILSAEEEHQTEIEQLLSRELGKREIAGCVLILPDCREYIYGFEGVSVDTTRLQVICGLGNGSNGKINWYTIGDEFGVRQYDKYLVAGMRIACENNLDYGKIYLFLHSECLENILKSMTNEKNVVVIMDDKGKQLAVNDEKKLQKISRSSMKLIIELYEEESGFFNFRNFNKQYITAHYRSRESGFKIFEVYDKFEFYKEVYKIILVTILLLIFFIFMIGEIFFLIKKQYINPMIELKDKISRLDGTMLMDKLEIKGNDEINIVIDQYNKMLHRLRTIIEEIKDVEEQKRKAEIETMRYQINPHFLYNTLSNMKILAMIKGEQEISDSLSRLAALLKYSLSYSSNFVNIKDEIEFIKNYTSLMNLRYENHLCIDFLVNEGLNDCKIPIFLLQPIVENAIVHGLSEQLNKGINSLIRIRIMLDGKYLMIKVYDNGKGMDDDKIKTILDWENIPKPQTGIGLHNVISRLKFLYDDNFKLDFHSVKGEYTDVIVCLPYEID